MDFQFFPGYGRVFRNKVKRRNEMECRIWLRIRSILATNANCLGCFFFSQSRAERIFSQTDFNNLVQWWFIAVNSQYVAAFENSPSALGNLRAYVEQRSPIEFNLKETLELQFFPHNSLHYHPTQINSFRYQALIETKLQTYTLDFIVWNKLRKRMQNFKVLIKVISKKLHHHSMRLR